MCIVVLVFHRSGLQVYGITNVGGAEQVVVWIWFTDHQNVMFADVHRSYHLFQSRCHSTFSNVLVPRMFGYFICSIKEYD